MAYRAHEYKSDDELQVSFLNETMKALAAAYEQLADVKAAAPTGAATFFGGAERMYASAATAAALASVINLIKSVGEIPASPMWVATAEARLGAAMMTGASLGHFNGNRHVEEAMEILQEVSFRRDAEEEDEEDEEGFRQELEELRLEISELRGAQRLD